MFKNEYKKSELVNENNLHQVIEQFSREKLKLFKLRDSSSQRWYERKTTIMNLENCQPVSSFEHTGIFPERRAFIMNKDWKVGRT
jgi:hypothetical protein